MKMEFGDNELRAYLAGKLAPDDAAALEAALQVDPLLDARLLQLEPLAGPLQSVFENLPDHSRLPDVEQVSAEPTRGLRHMLPYGAVAAVAGFIGVALAWWTEPDRPLTWQEQVAVYQALYVADTVAPLTPTRASLEIEFERASDALGLTLSSEDYIALPGFQLKRAQILGFEGAPLIQIAFATESGAPVAFCIIKIDAVSETTMTELSGLPTVHWTDGNYGYMLIGDVPEQSLTNLARQFGATL